MSGAACNIRPGVSTSRPTMIGVRYFSRNSTHWFFCSLVDSTIDNAANSSLNAASRSTPSPASNRSSKDLTCCTKDSTYNFNRSGSDASSFNRETSSLMAPSIFARSAGRAVSSGSIHRSAIVCSASVQASSNGSRWCRFGVNAPYVPPEYFSPYERMSRLQRSGICFTAVDNRLTWRALSRSAIRSVLHMASNATHADVLNLSGRSSTSKRHSRYSAPFIDSSPLRPARRLVLAMLHTTSVGEPSGGIFSAARHHTHNQQPKALADMEGEAK